MQWQYWYLSFSMKNTLVLLFFTPIILMAQQLRVDAATSYIAYEASHPIHDWSGTSDAVQGIIIMENNTPKRMAIAAAVSSFNSKNSNRDAHALEVLEALRFPKVSFYTLAYILVFLLEVTLSCMDRIGGLIQMIRHHFPLL